jgi:hypothetical protein
MSFAVAAFVAMTTHGAVFVVPANPIWTDTGISVATTDVVQISGATGWWSWETDIPSSWSGPDGSYNCSGIWDERITNARHGQLIGYVGNAPNALAQNDPGLFSISTNSVTVVGKVGELWLGINDAQITGHVSDNGGSVTVSVTRATLPQTLAITLSGPDVRLTIPAIPNELYNVQTTTNLISGPWSTIASNLVGTGGVLTNTDSGAVALPQRFYRMAIRTAPPPASDNAGSSAYGCGWFMSDYGVGIDGGTGFGPWLLTATGVIGSSSNGFFIGSSTNNGSGTSPGIDVTGQSWGIYANTTNFTAAYRLFANGPLSVGATFQIHMDNGPVDTGRSVGFVLRNGNASSSPSDYNSGARFEFRSLGGGADYQVVDASGTNDIGVPVTYTGKRLKFTLTGTNTYALLTIDNASGATNTWSGTLAGTGTVDSLAVYNRNAGSSPGHDAYFNSLQILSP